MPKESELRDVAAFMKKNIFEAEKREDSTEFQLF